MSDQLLAQIEKMIYVIRGSRVMLDSDLAKLYGVETRSLNQAVKRNAERFPQDFLFQPNFNELEDLRSQFVIANPTSTWNYKNRVEPFLFTENGVAMLSSVLHSKTAVEVNIAIMRTFTKLRSCLTQENHLENRLDKLEQNTAMTFKIVFERLDDLETTHPLQESSRKKIGLKNE